MNVLIEEMKQEARENGLTEGRKKEKNQIARSLLAEGLDSKLISRTTGLTIDEIKNLAN